MHQIKWDLNLLKQCSETTGLTFQHDEVALSIINSDFGRLTEGRAVAFVKPTDKNKLQQLLRFANKHKLPLTIRSHGLSQSGQSLADDGAVCVDVSELNTAVNWQGDKLIAGCSASWKSIISHALEKHKLPQVVPYNTNLTLGGVLSVGGVGASSFKEGTVTAHINEIELITAQGDLICCNESEHSDLFRASLSGVGQFGVIFKATLALRPAKKMVRVFTLIYTDYALWLHDQFTLKDNCDYLEAFISDSRGEDEKKLCITKVAIEYEDKVNTNILNGLHFTGEYDIEDLSISDYMLRHDVRLNNMQKDGYWEQVHPWYECYVARDNLLNQLDRIVDILDENIGGIYHIFPVEKQTSRYFMLPEDNDIVTFNVLSPGVSEDNLQKTLNALLKIDEIFLSLGGKRYISGWFKQIHNSSYWASHYGTLHNERQHIKAVYDPNHIFCSQLFPR